MSLYYTLKRLIPRRLQISLRRALAQQKRKKYSHIWPIDERATKYPEGWAGWPAGKKFALVLTHDVESARGIPRCLPLADLEEKLGFRSSFNFVAEDYVTPHELLDNLRSRRFEIGLHGLKHDGSLFKSKKFFSKNVDRINQYLKNWGASGFRSPSMYRNLEWIGNLDIEYDSSTFDTDPFEPQPDGVGTIFPFWVTADGRAATTAANSLTPGTIRPEVQPVICNLQPATVKLQPPPPTSNLQPRTVSHMGFVELPYTLPQDHALFVIMQERDIGIWKRKLGWIAECGGMALLITHPDYMNFDGRDLRIEEYPAEYYEEFLAYIKCKYEGQYWHVLPKEMARFWARNVSKGFLSKI